MKCDHLGESVIAECSQLRESNGITNNNNNNIDFEIARCNSIEESRTTSYNNLGEPRPPRYNDLGDFGNTRSSYMGDFTTRSCDNLEESVALKYIPTGEQEAESSKNFNHILICQNNHPRTLSSSSRMALYCCRGKCWGVLEHLDEQNFPLPFLCHQAVFAIMAMVMFLYDVGSDILLARQYMKIQLWTAFGISTTFIVVPSLMSNILSVYFDFYFDTNQKVSLRKRDLKSMSRSCWIPTILTFPFMLGPVVSNLEYVIYGWKSRSAGIKDDEKRKYYYDETQHYHVHVCVLRILETYLEAIPQLIFQLYFILTEAETLEDEAKLDVLRAAAMVGSWMAISVAPYSLFKFRKDFKHTGRKNSIPLGGLFSQLILRAFEIAPRIIVFALFASEFHLYTLILIAAHWIAMFILVQFQIHDDIESKLVNKLLLIFVSYVMIFSVMNVSGKKKKINFIVFYLVTYTENIGMLLTWAVVTKETDTWYYFAGCIVIPVGMVINLFLRFCYYKKCEKRLSTDNRRSSDFTVIPKE